MIDISKVFNRNLEAYLKLNDKKYSDLAEHLGVGKSTVSNWKNGLSLPRMEQLPKIAEFLNIEVYQLLTY